MPIIIPDDLPYTPRGIECIRFGARRGGEGIGCCAIDVMQGFSNDPDGECPPNPRFDGDSWSPEGVAIGGPGITNEMAFLSYLYHGSFTVHEGAPDHGFIVTMTETQCNSAVGKKWLQILKREGFEWIGCVNNSVYSELHPNHVFMLLRTVGRNLDEDEIESLKEPPTYWKMLPAPEQTPAERFESLASFAKRAQIPWRQEELA